MTDGAISQMGLHASSAQNLRVSDIVAIVVQKVLPFIDVFGMIGNILCICICLSRRLRRAPTTLHLTALAVYDLLFLIAVIPLTFDGSGAETLTKTKLGCWTFHYAIGVASCLSAWTVTAFTVERFIVVYFPLHRAAVCTIKNTIIILLCLIPIPLLFNSYIFFLPPAYQGVCKFNDKHIVLFNLLNLIDSVMANLIPLIAIFTFNCLIAFRMWKYDQQRKENTELRLHHTAALSTRSSAKTKSLIIVSTTFAILNVPIYAIRLKENYVSAFGSWEEDWTEFDKIFKWIAILLYHLNFSVDFLLYNLSSESFRRVAMDIILPKSLRLSTSSRATAPTSV